MRIKIDESEISEPIRGGGGRSVCSVSKEVVDAFKEVLDKRKGEPFALPAAKVKGFFRYTGKANKTNNVCWTINKHLKAYGLRLFSSHGGEKIGVEYLPTE